MQLQIQRDGVPTAISYLFLCVKPLGKCHGILIKPSIYPPIKPAKCQALAADPRKGICLGGYITL